MDKMKMELVWHNCKTCPPSESLRHNLVMWDGQELVDVDWDNGWWFHDCHCLDITGEEENCWWADFQLTTKRFFILNLATEK